MQHPNDRKTPLQLHVEKWSGCTACELHAQRRKVVVYRGAVPCDVLFVGEAPGESEDSCGYPFVGPAGHLLDKLVRRVMGAAGRLDAVDGRCDLATAFTNLVCCFPKEAKRLGVNEPPQESIKACAPRLVEFVRLAKPRLIVLAGKLAKRHVYGAAQFRLDGLSEQPEWIPNPKMLEFCEIVHPAAILRATAAQQGLMVQKTVATLTNAFAAL